jgi:arylsulfatase A-like enzyme
MVLTSTSPNGGVAPTTYFAPYNIATLPDGPKGEYLTDRLGDAVVNFIEQRKDRPFFVYFPQFAVHLPFQAKRELTEKYRARKHAGQMHTNEVYAAMIESMDDTVGQIRRKLDELKLAECTIIIFASDNGGRVPSTSNLPLRVERFCYEGGTRVPLIVYWPGVTRPGSVSDAGHQHGFISHVAGNGGVKDVANKTMDGVSLFHCCAKR